MAGQARSLDIILPCYNPPEGWARNALQTLNALREALPDTRVNLIVVNDGTTGGFAEADKEVIRSDFDPAGVCLLSHKVNKGKGAALRTGVRESNADHAIYTDIDFPYTMDSLLRMYSMLRKDEGDVVAGVRDASYYKGVPAGRRRISRFLRWMLRTFLRLQITDTQAGLKGFNRKGRELFLKTRINRFLFDLEFIFLASGEKGLKLTPAEVELREGVVFSKVNYRILLREGWNFLGIFFRGIGRGLRGRSRG